jgi:elongation factor 1-beta
VAKVLVVLKVYPSSIDVNLETLKNKISGSLPKDYTIRDYGIEPIAFGLKALKLLVEMPEETIGGTELLGSTIRGLDEVEEVEVEAVHRTSE